MDKKKLKLAVIFALTGIFVCGGAICASLYFSASFVIHTFDLQAEPSLFLLHDITPYAKGWVRAISKLFFAGSFVIPIFIYAFFVYRLFRGNSQPLHGDARLATRKDLAKAGLLTPDSPEDKHPSVLLGKMGNDFLYCRGQQFIFLSAPTGAGKGVGVVIPNCLHYRDSLVNLDIKEENFIKTAGFRARSGQEVYKFAPAAEDFITDCWNPLSYVRDNPLFTVSDLMGITTILYPPSDDVWASTAESIFIGLSLYVMETSKLKETHLNIAAIKKLIVNLDCLKDEDTFMLEVANRKDFEPLSEDCVTHLRSYAQTSEKLRNSILISFNQPLAIFSDPITAKATSKDTFDLRDVRKKRMSIYVVIPPSKIEKFGKLLNLFFSQLLNENMNEEPADNPELKYQCLLLLDEFPAMGKVGIIAKASAFMRSYDMRLLLIFQSKGQLEDQLLYGDKGAENLLTNMTVQIAYPPRVDKDAREYSEMIGNMTYKSTSTSNNTGVLSNLNASESISDQARAVLLPQEIKALGKDKSIVSMADVKPAVVNKIFWYKEDVFIAREGLKLPDVPNHLSDINFIEEGRELISPQYQGMTEEQPFPEGATYEVGFSPRRNALEVVLSFIANTEEELLVAAYSFTSKDISHALVEAKDRGVDVRVVVDEAQNSDEQLGYKAIDYLESEDISVFRTSNYAAMHHKFMVSDNQHVQLGSFNYTASANSQNAETAIVHRNVEDLAALFSNEWLRLTTEPSVNPDIIKKVDKGVDILKSMGFI